jgi:peptide/nickel transport system substrate-binding protein
MKREDEAVEVLAAWMHRELSRRQALRRLLALGLTVPSAGAVLAACTSGSSQGQSSQSSTKSKLTVGIVQEPTSLDPAADATASISLLLRDNVYEGLVRLDPSLKVVPGLARSWEQSSDGRNFTFHLASGVKWHDGSPFSAQDVKASWDRAMDPATKPVNPHVDYWAPVQSVEVADDRTVKVTLKQYSDNWLFHMTAGSAAIFSARSLSQNARQPVGTGTFKFGSWNRGSSLSLTRNDGYWGSKAKLKDVEFRFITDPNAMNNALKAGDIDAIGQVGGPEQVGSFQSDSRFKVLKSAPVGKVMVAMNNSRAPLNDVRVRRAISMAIDRKAWIDGIQSGFAVPIGSHAVPNSGEPYYLDLTNANRHDPAQAKQLLVQAGHGDGLTLTLVQITDFPYAVRGTDILNSELKEIGITLKVDTTRFPDWLTRVFLPTGPQDYDLTIINHAEERDIGNYANPRYYWHYASADVSGWLARADAEPDQTTRKDLYAQVQRTLADEAANGFVMSPNTLAVVRSSLRDYPAVSLSSPLYLANTSFS